MEHIPLVTTAPPPRCAYKRGSAPGSICGDVAAWKRPGNHFVDDAFFCNAHREACDVELAGEVVYRRLHVHCDIILAGVTMREPIAKAEALTRLTAALEAAGAVLDVHGISSNAVRARVQRPEGSKRAG